MTNEKLALRRRDVRRDGDRHLVGGCGDASGTAPAGACGERDSEAVEERTRRPILRTLPLERPPVTLRNSIPEETDRLPYGRPGRRAARRADHGRHAVRVGGRISARQLAAADDVRPRAGDGNDPASRGARPRDPSAATNRCPLRQHAVRQAEPTRARQRHPGSGGLRRRDAAADAGRGVPVTVAVG